MVPLNRTPVMNTSSGSKPSSLTSCSRYGASLLLQVIVTGAMVVYTDIKSVKVIAMQPNRSVNFDDPTERYQYQNENGASGGFLLNLAP